ncbi:DCC1-like thiol-disulfide oxidoreductase family protein [Roseomonas sp. CAU 1739]|uniref:thiol-disulfide oxidoreductase DCC family protein n=1 Tax=Roseomonas sp. CAU 1739 TaxID=3140364 RepID=UPI00325B53DC
MDAAGPIIVFDTDCVLCSGMVAFVLAHERASDLRFAGAWSAEGLALAGRHGFTRDDLEETFLVIDGDRALARSDGGIAVARHLRRPWRWLAMAAILPRPMRDALYVFVARRRYRWFGRRRDCTIIPPAQRHRFIGLPGNPGSG